MKIIKLKETKQEAIKVEKEDTNGMLEKYIPKVDYIEREFYHLVVHLIEQEFTPYLVGDSGTGKTAFAEWYACENQLPLLIVNCDYKNLRELLGQWTLTNGPTGPQTIFQVGLLTHFLTSRSVVLFDEVNSLEGEYLFFLHELINNRQVFIPEIREVIPVEATIILASNPTGKIYYGTQPLNYALLSRVVVVDVPLWEEKELKQIIQDPEARQFFFEANKMSKEQNLGVYVGIRELLQYQKLAPIVGKCQAIKVAFLNKVKCVDEDTAKAFCGIASSVFGVGISLD
jgi:MoxR-like ATPase